MTGAHVLPALYRAASSGLISGQQWVHRSWDQR